ncbi:MAG: NADPH-dependent glutamate synthase [Planctomycetaceae bacterium]|jgi:glutamate synthase (NADPH/NADH) small chain|nr:NADPH-dependent glutamate synthase [Planctomycetaceae bacterium]
MKKSDKTGRVAMPEQPPEVRIRNFDEVPLGYDDEQARTEASRCLQCKKPSCRDGCPVQVDIPAFIGLIAEGRVLEAAAKIKEDNCLPAACGRVCPQEIQCEGRCVLAKKGTPVAIGNLERYAAHYASDHAARHGLGPFVTPAPPTGKRVAVVGAGPSGLTVAGDLVRRGHDVTVFEAFHKAGGVLIYGIPEFRLPKRIVQEEVEYLAALGVRFELNHVIGKAISVHELLEKEGFDAVFLGVGAGLPSLMGIPGENLGGVYLANEYLTRVNLMRAYDFPRYDTPIVRGRNVCVIGGGNVAMDAARTARRLDAEQVSIVYRRSVDELPARAEEVHHAQEEGIHFKTLCSPLEYLGDDRGMVKQVRCQIMELGEPDASGRRRPVPVPGKEATLDADLVIIAIGGNANPIVTRQTEGLALNKHDYITIDENGATSVPGIWAGGDIVTGSATVILAMGAGRIAAQDIHRFLCERN